MQASHLVTIYGKRFRAIGVAGILIALYVIGYGGYGFDLAFHRSRYYTSIQSVSYVVMQVVAGIWFLVTAYAAIATARTADHRPDFGGAVAIIASLFALILAIFEIAVLIFAFQSCNSDESTCNRGLLVPEVLLAILLFVQFIMSIAHADLSCRKGGTLSNEMLMVNSSEIV